MRARGLRRQVVRSAIRVGRTAQNALEVARFGGLDTGEQSSPFDVVGRTRVYKLRRYFPEHADDGRPAMLLVPPLMLTAEVYDVAGGVSGVEALHQAGVDVWVVDFGAPEREEGGLQRTLADHVLAVSDAIDRVRRATGGDVHLGGYSQGGMFCYQVAAFRRGEGIASLTTFGSPVDVHLLSPAGLPVAELADLATSLATTVLSRTSVPPALSRRVFQLIDPLKTAQARVDFLRKLHNRDALLEREGSRRFLEVDGWVAWPGPAVAEFASQFIAHNRMLQGGFVIDEQVVSLADIDLPILAVVGAVDEIAAPAAVRAVRRAIPASDIWELTLQAGHMGLVVGRGAREASWPVVAAWVRWRAGLEDQPPELKVLDESAAEEDAADGAVEVVTEVAVAAAQVVTDTAISAVRAVRGVVGEALDTLPRLARLQRIEPDTRVSMSLLAAERARRHPDDTFFMFEGRGYTYAEAMRRVDAVARGLLSLGVRQGEHVGVLMGTRPTAVALVTALNQVGAVAVMLRADGDLPREMRLGHVSRLITDPDHVAQALEVADGQVLVLGTGGEASRTLPDGVVDMERIDPSAVSPPGWYQPHPGLARDLAMIVFTGEGTGTRTGRVTNRRYAVSAIGTASAASLGRADTVYAVTPIHHPSTLLTAIGGALVSGARLAVGARFAPQTFWDEVRRYGVTVVSYTWAMAGPLIAAPPSPAERHHPIRLFMGSGMPSGHWARLQDRFRPAQVLEFYAHTEGEAVLANLTRDKVGAMGRELPGTAEVAVASWDPVTGQLRSGPDGFVREAEVGETGMLLARAARDRSGVRGRLLRGVFQRGDAWLQTGDLFVRDEDGDLWLQGGSRTVIHTDEGPVFPAEVARAVEGDDAVDLCAVHGHLVPGAEAPITVAAVTLREGRELTDERMRTALQVLDGPSWPTVIRVLDEMPLSTHHRVLHSELQAKGLQASDRGLVWDAAAGAYVPLTGEELDALTGG